MPHVRPEARPLGWASLDQAQKKAFVKIARMLKECVDALPEEAKCESAFRSNQSLDAKKSSRTAFLTGGRGTGKTTVLLTLLQACQDLSTLGKEKTTERPDGVPSEIVTLVKELAPRVCWLETIDMEPLPPTANLLAAILARISDVVQQVESGDGDHRGILEPTNEFQLALAELNRLRTNVAVAWDGNIEARKAHLDTDAFAIELMRTEEARLNLLPMLRRVLDRLAHKSALRGNPLFLLPVDDFDLNPAACVGLLRLLRMVSAPRLFTLVLGDVEVADVIMHLKFSNDLADVYGNGKDLYGCGQAMMSPLSADVVRIAGEVSANAMRKLIPPEQRVKLPMLTVTESLNFRPPGAVEKDEFLHELLAKCEVQRVPLTRQRQGDSIETLSEFLLRPGMLPEAPKPKKQKKEKEKVFEQSSSRRFDEVIVFPYQALAMFQSTPRRIIDLWLGLDRLIDGKEKVCSADFIDFFAGYCGEILAEERSLTPESRQNAPLALVRTATGDWDLTRLPFYVQSQSGQLNTFEFTKQVAETDYRLRFQFGGGGGWRFEVDQNPITAQRQLTGTNAGREFAERRDRAPDLSPHTAGAIMLIHDLLVLGPECARLQANLIHWDIGDQWAVVEWSRGVQQRMRMRWPPPPGNSFYEFDHFQFMWRNALKHVTSQPHTGIDPVVAAAFHWIDIGTAVLDGESPLAVKEYPTTTDWHSLRERLEKLVDTVANYASPQDKSAAWLSDVCIITMPERGLPPQVHEQLAPAESKLHEYWIERAWRLIRRRRVSRLAEMFVQGMPELAESLRCQEHLHRRLVPSKAFLEREADMVASRPGIVSVDEAFGDEAEPKTPRRSSKK